MNLLGVDKTSNQDVNVNETFIVDGTCLALINIDGSSIIEMYLLDYWSTKFIGNSHGEQASTRLQVTNSSGNKFSFKNIHSSAMTIRVTRIKV